MAQLNKKKLSAIVLTKNEEKNIVNCVERLDFCDEIIILDSGSQDKTIEFAGSSFVYEKIKVYYRELKDFSDQRNFGISVANSEWILFIDADERVTPILEESILRVINQNDFCNGYYIKRKNYIFGKLLKHGLSKEDQPLRLVKKYYWRQTESGVLKMEDSKFVGKVHEKIEIKDSAILTPGFLIHNSTPNIHCYLEKLKLYTSFNENLKYSPLKLILKPALRFIQIFFLKLGFLDGVEGFIFAMCSSFNEFVLIVKAREKQRSLKGD